MKKIVIIGAGSSMFTKKLIGDLLSFNDIMFDEFALVDINAEKLAVMDEGSKKTLRSIWQEREGIVDRQPHRGIGGFFVCNQHDRRRRCGGVQAGSGDPR